MEEKSTPKPLDVDVWVYPAQENSGNLLATASVTLGGCFAIKGIHIVDSEKGVFVSMPRWKDGKNEYHDICFPTTKEMRDKLNSAVLDAYAKTMERNFARVGQAMEKRDAAESRPRSPEKKRGSNRDAR